MTTGRHNFYLPHSGSQTPIPPDIAEEHNGLPIIIRCHRPHLHAPNPNSNIPISPSRFEVPHGHASLHPSPMMTPSAFSMNSHELPSIHRSSSRKNQNSPSASLTQMTSAKTHFLHKFHNPKKCSPPPMCLSMTSGEISLNSPLSVNSQIPYIHASATPIRLSPFGATSLSRLSPHYGIPVPSHFHN